jgi:lipopolysaccharide transport system permease protein
MAASPSRLNAVKTERSPTPNGGPRNRSAPRLPAPHEASGRDPDGTTDGVLIWHDRRSFPQDLKRLVSYRELLLTWTQREIKIRYKQAILGGAWAVIQPLALMTIFTIVFTQLIRLPTTGVPYPLFAYAGLLPWVFVSNSISTGVTSVVTNMSIVTKVNFPKEILGLAQIGVSLVDYWIALALFLVMLLAQQSLHPGPLWMLPCILLFQVALASGIVLLTSAATVRYRDIRFIVPLALQLWLYATPVIYPIDVIPNHWQWLIRANPLTGIIEGYRSILLYGSYPNIEDILSSIVVSCGVLIVGYVYFKKTEIWFADIS